MAIDEIWGEIAKSVAVVNDFKTCISERAQGNKLKFHMCDH